MALSLCSPTGRQNANRSLSSCNSAKYRFFVMTEEPTGSETILPQSEEAELKAVEPVETKAADPVEEFRKGKAKREYKRKEVKIIQTHVPPDEPPPAPSIDPESIARRTAEIVLSAMGSKMAAESEEVEAKPKRTRQKKEVSPPPPPTTKSFGWC